MKYQIRINGRVTYVTDVRISQDQLKPYFIEHEFMGADVSEEAYTWIFITRKKARGS
jgi:hypothetical protein